MTTTGFVAAVRSDGQGSYEGGCSCGYRTAGWSSEDNATGRLQQHTAEHETGELTPELIEYRRAIGDDVNVVPRPSSPFGDDQSED